MMVKGQYGRGRSLLDEAVSLLEHYGEGEVGETAELGIRVHLQYLKVYTRRSKCFIHIGFLNKAIGDSKKALKLIDLCNRLIEDNCGVLVGVNANDTGERDKFRTLLALKRKEVQKIMRDAKQRREKDKNFVRAMMSKTIALQNCIEPEDKATAQHEDRGFPDLSTGNHLPSEVVEEDKTDLISTDVDESEDEGDHTDLFVAHQKNTGCKSWCEVVCCWKNKGGKFPSNSLTTKKYKQR